MRVAIGADHGGFELKRRLVRALQAGGHEVADLGTHSPQPCDYPRYGEKVARVVSDGAFERGILICKSGIGMSIVANKFSAVKAALCRTVKDATLSREHNDANVLIIGTNDTAARTAQRMVAAWLATPFEGGRHARRVRQIAQIERRLLRGAKDVKRET
jgi:ribose 5-phosphate isomerase B